VCVMGAGAMGCLIGGLLHEGGLDVTLVDTWQAHIDAINSTGLKLTGEGGDRTIKPKATSDVASLGKFDVIIVQCKATATKTAIESALPLFHDTTVAISLQNGLGNENVMAEVLAPLGGGKRVFGGQTLQGANIVEPGCIKIHTNLMSYIGEWEGGLSERCGKICKAFTAAGLPSEEHPDIAKKIWMKAIYNCVVSPLSAITNKFHKDVYCRHDAMYVAELITNEALAVAKAEGIQVSDEEARECLDKVIKSNQSNKSSMAMDIDAKRQSEMDFINGFVVTLAAKHNIEVPMNRTMVFFVKALESHFLEAQKHGA